MSKKSLNFHIKSDDYFGTLATVLSFIKQDIIFKKHNINSVDVLEKLEKDLLFLQKEYKIVKK
jgi:hypothetical protein